VVSDGIRRNTVQPTCDAAAGFDRMKAYVGFDGYILENVVHSIAFSYALGNVAAQSILVFLPEVSQPELPPIFRGTGRTIESMMANIAHPAKNVKLA
jgi:hypothetical protein